MRRPNAQMWQIECAVCKRLHPIVEHENGVTMTSLDPTLLIHCPCGSYIRGIVSDDNPTGWKFYIHRTADEVTDAWTDDYSARWRLQ